MDIEELKKYLANEIIENNNYTDRRFKNMHELLENQNNAVILISHENYIFRKLLKLLDDNGQSKIQGHV